MGKGVLTGRLESGGNICCVGFGGGFAGFGGTFWATDLRSNSLVAAMDVRSVVDLVLSVVELISLLGSGLFTLVPRTGSDLTPQSRKYRSSGSGLGAGQLGKTKLSANTGDAKNNGKNPVNLIEKFERGLVGYRIFDIAKMNINCLGI
jgi:hypothetical protein